MDQDRRELINHIGSELARSLEDASVEAALLPSVQAEQLTETLSSLARGISEAQALVSAMQALSPKPLLASVE